MESHQNLWGIRAFLNPRLLSRKDQVHNACEFLFTFDDEAKTTYGRYHYRNVVDEIARSNGISTLPYDEYSQRADRAVERLMTQTASLRTREELTRIVLDAFAS